MRNIVILITVITFTMCNTQNKDEKIIAGFLKNIVLNESYEIETINKYVDINKNIPDQQREGVYKLIQMQITELREELKNSNVAYKIIAHHNAKGNKQIKEYNLNYDNYDNVYYLLNNEEIVTFFIIHKGKIRAFFLGITKKANKRNPLLLNME